MEQRLLFPQHLLTHHKTITRWHVDYYTLFIYRMFDLLCLNDSLWTFTDVGEITELKIEAMVCRQNAETRGQALWKL